MPTTACLPALTWTCSTVTLCWLLPRWTDVVGIFANEDAIRMLVGAILLELNEQWAVQRSRYMPLESIAKISDNDTVSLATLVA